MDALGWPNPDVILVTGDSYIDSPHIGVAVIGKTLAAAGYRVGIIAQPDMSSDTDITRLGEPALFWGVTGGCMDSMIANTTATMKPRKSDDLTAGGQNNRRPDRAVIAYANLIRRHFKSTRPIVLGGMEASLRRISHYDYWSDSVRRSVLFDAKADLLVYGMGEKTILEIASRIKRGESLTGIRGTCHAAKEAPDGYLVLPSHAEAAGDTHAFEKMFQTFYQNNDPFTAKGMCQLQDTRYLVHHPPQFPPSPEDLDRIFELDYERAVHPVHQAQGPVRAMETIRFSLTTHRGCFGECNFCAIAVHEGKAVISRSEASILREAKKITQHPDFKGIITDMGGPTANMYGMACGRKSEKGLCAHKRCLVPAACSRLGISHERQIELLRRIRNVPGIRRVFIGSGVRHDLVLQDRKWGEKYLEEIASHHISGQLKIAPEHSEDHVLKLMGKPGGEFTEKFIALYDRTNRALGKKQFLTCYFIAAYPGCTMDDMRALKSFIRKNFKFTPEQIQIFTPGPSTVASAMYHTGSDLVNDEPLYVEKGLKNKEAQKKVVVGEKGKPPGKRRKNSE